MSSILKSNNSVKLDDNIKKVRFSFSQDNSLKAAIDDVLEHQNYRKHDKYIINFNQSADDDLGLIDIIGDARKHVHLLKPGDFSHLIESILGIDWFARDTTVTSEYNKFIIELVVAHNKYTNYVIQKLIATWVPKELSENDWKDGNPSDETRLYFNSVHDLLRKILFVVPMAFGVVIEKLHDLFPYHRKPSYVICGFLFNVLLLLEYRSDFIEHVIDILFTKLVTLDVNTPRHVILNSQLAETKDELKESKIVDSSLGNSLVDTLDLCMDKLFVFSSKISSFPSSKKATSKKHMDEISYFKILLKAFGNVILPSHNTHHIQFLMFHYCSLEKNFTDQYLNFLWGKIIDLNLPAPIRQSSVSYLVSFLARAKFVSLNCIKQYLYNMSNWVHGFIDQTESIRSNVSFKANIVFYSICQAIFYLIAFRSRDLTSDRKSILFLETLQLSTIVNCGLNPLRVCLPAVATIFAGVTRAHQLVYCHTILERNARQKLATIYANDTIKPEQGLETVFPFDPYLLKRSVNWITPLYLQYESNEIDENSVVSEMRLKRKRNDSEMNSNENDEFIDIATNKSVKLLHNNEIYV